MTANEPSRGRPTASSGRLASPLAAATPDTLAGQIDGLARDLAAHRLLLAGGDALARGAALAAAHGALALATAPLPSPTERALRRAALDEAVPALVRAGLGHIADLIAAALQLEHHPISLTRTWGEPQ